MWEWPAFVETVHDGDTVTVTIDRGFDDHKTSMKLRLEDVFAPELSQLGGIECRQFVMNWLTEAGIPYVTMEFPLIVTTVRLKNGKRELKTLERYVSRVNSRDGRSLNQAIRDFIIANGYPAGVGG